MNENFILVGRKCFSLDLTNLEDEFVDFFSSSPFSSDAVSSNVVYLCSIVVVRSLKIGIEALMSLMSYSNT